MPDSLPALLALLLPTLLALAAGVGWLLSGRRPRPPAPPAVVAAAHVDHARRVELAELDHARTVEEVEGRASLPVEVRREKAATSWKGRAR